MNDSLRHEETVEKVRLHRPLPLDEREFSRTARAAKKPVARRELTSFESVDEWSVSTPGKMRLCEGSIEFTSPTRLDAWSENYARIYATPYLTLRLEQEDWSDFNRVSVSIRPEMPGFKFVSLHLLIVNSGATQVPDRYMREGFHNFNLLNHEWNDVSVEIPNLSRDQVTEIKFGYDIVGNENEATETACFYISRLVLERVESPAHYEGWRPAAGEVVFSGSGYQPSAVKRAFGGELLAGRFRVVEAGSGRVVLDKAVDRIATDQGSFAVLDFTEVADEGRYLLVWGDYVSKTFPISEGVWEDAIWKTINLLFCERCGFEVPGFHKYCHGNVTVRHGEKRVVSNGGWHDAADMSQNLTNTAEATYALFRAAENATPGSPLFDRLVEEGKWGLEWMLKTRFGDGYRAMGSGTSVWTSGILGGVDDVEWEAQDLAIENFMAAGAEALAARILRTVDPEQSAYLIRVSQADWKFAAAKIDREEYVESMDPARVSSPVLLYSSGVIAACEILRATGDLQYATRAAELAELVIECQQVEYPEWGGGRVTGFFYRDVEHSQIQHYNHRSHEHKPALALALLCDLCPDDPAWPKWYHSLLLHTEYYKSATESTAPYRFSPASIYHEGEAQKNADLFLKQQAFAHPGMLDEYRAQVESGVGLGDGFFLRRFPVWFSYRGNNALVLAGGTLAAYAAQARNDADLLQIAREQLEWVGGKNPFGESLMLGEGYNYATQYVCLPGEIAGSICVGIESLQNEDRPYWPQANNAVYREMWVHPSITFLLLSSLVSSPPAVHGVLPGYGPVHLTELRTGKELLIEPEGPEGYFEVTVPSGQYRIVWNGMSREMSLVSGGRYELRPSFADCRATWERQGKEIEITLFTSGKGRARFEFRSDNLLESPAIFVDLGTEVRMTTAVIDTNRPWLFVVLPEGDAGLKVEVFPHMPPIGVSEDETDRART